jgi:hypothetical protein
MKIIDIISLSQLPHLEKDNCLRVYFTDGKVNKCYSIDLAEKYISYRLQINTKIAVRLILECPLNYSLIRGRCIKWDWKLYKDGTVSIHPL